jgi:hypothetical protein
LTHKCEGSFSWIDALSTAPVPATTVLVKEPTGSRVTRAFLNSLTNSDSPLPTLIPKGLKIEYTAEYIHMTCFSANFN